jgi:hypothetical protein
MKQKIDHCEMNDLIEVKALLKILVMLRVSEASPIIDSVYYSLKYDFCEHCDQHIDGDCSCDQEYERDGRDMYDDGADYE